MNFQIETTSFCDLTCKECVNVYMRRKRQFMSREVWNAILCKYVVPFRHLNAVTPPTLIPHKDGEPLLNKKLPDMLHAASDLAPDLQIDIYTHGLLLKEEFLAFLGSLPNRVRLLVSFHFTNHDGSTNDYVRTEAVLRKWLARPQHGPENIEFILASHLIAPMTRERLLEWKAGWRSLEEAGRVTVHANVSVNPWLGLIPEATMQHPACPYHRFDHIFFGATGNVIACCMDLEEEIVFGHVLKDDPAQMINVLREFYAAQARRDFKYDVCLRCLGMKEKMELVQVGKR